MPLPRGSLCLEKRLVSGSEGNKMEFEGSDSEKWRSDVDVTSTVPLCKKVRYLHITRTTCHRQWRKSLPATVSLVRTRFA